MSISTVKQYAYRTLRRRLTNGDFAAGTRLSDIALAREMGVSRAPIREALCRLESEGLLEQVPHVGMFVRELGRRDIEEMLDLRLVLECYAAERAATRVSDAQLDRLALLVAQMRRTAGELRAQLAARPRAGKQAGADPDLVPLQRRDSDTDAQFHEIILHAADNGRVAQTMRATRVLMELADSDRLNSELTTLRNYARTLREHHRILRALCRRDPTRAAAAMRHHLENLKHKMLTWQDNRDLPSVTPPGRLRDRLARHALESGRLTGMAHETD